MRKLAFIVLSVLSACYNDGKDLKEEFADCSAVTCSVNSIVLELTDENGNNLIENGTYKAQDIKVFSEGYERGEVSNNPEFGNTILVILDGGEGDVNYEVNLSKTESDTLRLNLSFLSNAHFCCPPDYKVNSARYNGTIQEIIRNEEEFPLEKIIVVK